MGVLVETLKDITHERKGKRLSQEETKMLVSSENFLQQLNF